MLTKITVMRIFIGPWTNQTRVEQDLYGFEDEKESRTRELFVFFFFFLSLFWTIMDWTLLYFFLVVKERRDFFFKKMYLFL